MVSKKVNSLIPRASRHTLYKFLMRDGTLVVKHQPSLPIHEKTKITNLHVMLMMRTMKTKEYVKHTYLWGYDYYILTPEGIEFLREQLDLPLNVMPATYASAKPAIRPESGKREAVNA